MTRLPFNYTREEQKMSKILEKTTRVAALALALLAAGGAQEV